MSEKIILRNKDGLEKEVLKIYETVLNSDGKKYVVYTNEEETKDGEVIVYFSEEINTEKGIVYASASEDACVEINDELINLYGEEN